MSCAQNFINYLQDMENLNFMNIIENLYQSIRTDATHMCKNLYRSVMVNVAEVYENLCKFVMPYLSEISEILGRNIAIYATGTDENYREVVSRIFDNILLYLILYLFMSVIRWSIQNEAEIESRRKYKYITVQESWSCSSHKKYYIYCDDCIHNVGCIRNKIERVEDHGDGCIIA